MPPGTTRPCVPAPARSARPRIPAADRSRSRPSAGGAATGGGDRCGGTSRRVDRVPLDRPIFVLGHAGRRNDPRGSLPASASLGREHERRLGLLGRDGRARLCPKPDAAAPYDALELGASRRPRPSALRQRTRLRLRVEPAAPGSTRNTADDATPADSARFKRILKEHIAVYADDRTNGAALPRQDAHRTPVKIPYLGRLLDGHEPFFLLVVRNPYTMCYRAVPPRAAGLAAGACPTRTSYDSSRRTGSTRRGSPSRTAHRRDGSWRCASRTSCRTRPESSTPPARRPGSPTTTTSCRARAIGCPSPRCPGTANGTRSRATSGATRSATSKREIVEEECGEVAEQLGYGQLTDTATDSPGPA